MFQLNLSMGVVFMKHVLATRTFISRRKLVSSRSAVCSSRYVDDGRTPHTPPVRRLLSAKEDIKLTGLPLTGAALATTFSASASRLASIALPADLLTAFS